MEKLDTFNVRVYGLIVHNDCLLILKEPYAGETLYKFPGGGLEFGEGLIDALKRELKEELGLNIAKLNHFYTQEVFMRSKFKSNEQLLTIYYKVILENIRDIARLEKDIQEILWVPLASLSTMDVNLPVDKIVVDKLIQAYKTNDFSK